MTPPEQVPGHDLPWYRLQVRLHSWGSGWGNASWPIKPFRWLSWAGFVSLLVASSPLAKQRRVRALVRLWAWEVWRRLVRRPIEIIFDNGVRLQFPPATMLAGVVAATGSHEPMEQTFLLHVLRPGDLAVDVGANVGIYSLTLAGLGVKVWAFEPSSAIRPSLVNNVQLNSAEDSVRVLPFALGAENGRALFTADLEGTNHLVTGHVLGPTEAVEIRTLDDVVADPATGLTGEDIFFLKVDAEGEDESVLLGAQELLARCHPVVIVETWDGGRSVRTLLASHGYRVYRYEVGRRKLVEYPSNWSGQANFIAVAATRAEQITTRLANSPDRHLTPPTIRWMPFRGMPFRANSDSAAAQLRGQESSR